MVRIFSKDAEQGITKYWHVTDKGEYVVETRQDVSAIVQANKRQMNDDTGKWGDINKVASIPLSVYYDLKRRGIADDPKALRKWMNDPDNRVFRTKGGTL